MKIVITQGMTGGIGPEIILKALPRFEGAHGTEVLVLGDPNLFAGLSRELGLPPLPDCRTVTGASTALAALEEAARLAADGRVDAIVTAPVNKAGLRAAGFPYPGQTEFFADRLGAESHAMMLADGALRVVPVTTHLALRDVADALDRAAVLERIRTVFASLTGDFGLASPRIAVLGLNPHAGERGLFGDEERTIVGPAVEAARAEGIDAVGPLPADAAFAPRARGGFDAFVGMYHDQVLGPFKALAGGGGVNVTIGLPAVRTSPDHGTAEDIAGTGRADPTSFLAALRLAERMAENRLRAAPIPPEFLGGPGGPH